MKTTKSLGKGGQVTIDNSGLERLQRELNRKLAIDIGILGGKVARQQVTLTKDGKKPKTVLTNAEIGLIQEKGSLSRRIPRRSFLEMPLSTKLNEELKSSGFENVTKNATSINFRTILTKIAIVAENVVQSAFDTAGFGKWTPNAPLTIKKKGSSRPLINFGELRAAVTHRLVEK